MRKKAEGNRRFKGLYIRTKLMEITERGREVILDGQSSNCKRVMTLRRAHRRDLQQTAFFIERKICVLHK